MLVLLLVGTGVWWVRSPDPRATLDALADPATYADLAERAGTAVDDALVRSGQVDAPGPVAIPGPDASGPGVGPAPGLEEADERLAPAVMVADPSPAYDFAALQDDGVSPVAWSPCRPLHYVVNPAGAPSGFVAAVQAVAAEVAAATGLVLTYDGTTAEEPTEQRETRQEDAYGDRWAPVLVAVADASTVGYLDGQVAGVAYTYRVGGGAGESWHLVSGAVYLDVESFDLPAREGEPPWIAVLRHEIGHLMGLDHVEDPSQLMNPVTSAARTFRAGDLTGLALLGQGDCAPHV